MSAGEGGLPPYRYAGFDISSPSHCSIGVEDADNTTRLAKGRFAHACLRTEEGERAKRCAVSCLRDIVRVCKIDTFNRNRCNIGLDAVNEAGIRV